MQVTPRTQPAGIEPVASDFSHHSHGELVVAIGSRVSRKTVNSVGRGPAYQDSGESHIARQQ